MSSSDPAGSLARPSQVEPLTVDEARALAFLLPLSADYPGIGEWFVNKVVPGLRLGTRFLLPVERAGDLVGVGIAKNELDERKICTVRVAPSHVGHGIGVRLFDGLLKWLNDDRPHLTVSATKLPLFAQMFDYYGFDITSAHEGLYVPGAIELGYNELTGPSTSTSAGLSASGMSWPVENWVQSKVRTDFRALKG